MSRRRASAGLALELAGAPAVGRRPGARAVGPQGPLVAGSLLLVEDAERPFLTRSLRVPDRVTAHLLGDDAPDPLIEPLLDDVRRGRARRGDRRRARARRGLRLVYLRERPGASGHSLG